MEFDPAINNVAIFDSTANGTLPGYQIRLRNAIGGHWHELEVRIFDGATWILTSPIATFQFDAWTPLKINVTTIVIDFTSALIDVDNATYANDTFASVTFPVGSPGPAVLGNLHVDFFALNAYPVAHTPAEQLGIKTTLFEEFSVDFVSQVAGTSTIPNEHDAFSDIAQATDGTFLVVYRHGTTHGSDNGEIRLRSSSDGRYWDSPLRTIQTLSGWDLRDPCIATLDTGELYVNYFANNPSTSMIQTTVSLDDAGTWSSPRTPTFGFSYFEACSSRVIQINGMTLLFFYAANLPSTTKSSAWVGVSFDRGVTYHSMHLMADGVADNTNYAEPGAVVDGNTIVALVRARDIPEMLNTRSTDAITWTALTPGPNANSAGRLFRFGTGEIDGLLRPNGGGATAFFLRTAVDTWQLFPEFAPRADAFNANCDYGGSVLIPSGSATSQRALRVYSREWSIIPPAADTVSQFWELFYETGNFPMQVTPQTATLAPGESLVIVAEGAGPFTYPFAPGGNPSGCPPVTVNGLLTAGAVPGVNTVNVTDLNGQIKPVVITVR